MKFTAVLKLAAAALATGALLVPGIAPAQAATYPPKVSVLYVSPVLSGGYASVGLSGDHLTTGMSVTAVRGTKATSATVHVDSSGTVGSAMVKVSSVLSTTAGRYTVFFTLRGASVTGTVATSQTYTVGKQISIKSFSLTRKSYGLYISGKAAKYAPVKITVKFGSRTYAKTVKSSSAGNFHWSFYKTTKGDYTVTADVASNTKYFSDSVSKSYTRH
jgi:hypothetical protein